MTSAVREEHDEHDQGSGPIKVTILASEWGSSKGGLSTINRELAIQLAKFPDVEITFLLPKCGEQDKKEALGHKINIVEATRRPGYEELEWLSFPPEHLEIDVVVGHGVKLGRQAQFIRRSHKCKWVQVVHTDPEELGMFKSYSNPISKGEEKHSNEVELWEMSDFVVGVGPKLTDACHSYLRRCRKHQTVFDFTPGVFDEFLSVQQVPEERKPFLILVFGRGDAEDFVLKGFDIAGKAVASLPDTHLVFVGAPDGKHEEIKQRLLDCGISASRLRVRGYVNSRESLKHLFCEVDIVLMPSRTEGFGLTGLEALSAGLPVLVSKNSGFGEALSKVPFGSSLVIDSEDPKVWATAIKNIEDKDRQSRLEEAKVLCSYYKKKYSWAKQSKDLLERMITMVHDFSSSFQRSIDAQISQRTEVTTEHHTDSSSSCQSSIHSAVAPRLPVRMDCEIVPQNANVTPQQVLCRIADRYLQIVSPSTREELNKFKHYLQEIREMLILSVGPGSLIITLECRSLQILDGLWKDYCSGYLNEVAQKCLVTDDILQESDLLEVNLITTILEEDYRACRDCFLQFPAAVSLKSNQMETEDLGVKMEMEDVASALRDVTIDDPESLDPFVRKCLAILKQCTRKNLKEMKLRLQDAIPEMKVEKVGAPYELFSLMVDAKLLSPDNLSHLDDMLSSAGRQDLRQQFKEWDAFERKCLTILKQCTREDLKKMKGLLQGVLPNSKLQKVQEPWELFYLMVDAKLLSPDNLSHLDDLLSSAGRQDLRQQFKEWDTFERKCLAILKQCTSEDLSEMKKKLQHALPKRKLHKVQEQSELFALMVQAGRLSPDNLKSLGTALSSAGRQYLRKQLEEWDTFERKCLTILKQCTTEDLNKMKGWLQGDLPDSKLQKVEEPSELFSLMVEAGLLSPDNLHSLATALSSAGQQDLRKQLEESLDPFVRKCLAILKQCTSKDLNEMKLRLQDAVPKMKVEKVGAPYELFSLMVEAKLLSPDNLSHLDEMLSSAGRQDLRQQFKDWDSFEQKCLSLLNQCTTEELKEMNSWLRYATPAWKLEKARDRYELFTRMVNAELLSPDNLYFLARLLPFVDREDLKGELLKDQQFEEQILCEELVKDDANHLVTSGYVLTIYNETRHYFNPIGKFAWKFGFNTHQHYELSKSEMLKVLKETAEQDFSSYACFLLVIRGYGSKDGIYGKDDEVISLDAITSLFSQNKCPSLKGKPKIFLIEAVQKGDKVSGSDPSSSLTVSEADFLVNYATPEMEKRFSRFGFMSAVNYVFEVYSGKEDLVNMMMRVNKLTTKSYSASKMQSPTLISTLTKKVFFKP